MTPDSVISIGQQALQVTLFVAAPPLLAALITGVVISIFQAATQINETTLTFIPKLIVLFIALVVFGPWMLGVLVDYTQRLYASIPGFVG
ncbi:MAG: flagellar biosynthesis protein FliQ [Burkholderiales bacterium]